jgi:hypothetical protein
VEHSLCKVEIEVSNGVKLTRSWMERVLFNARSDTAAVTLGQQPTRYRRQGNSMTLVEYRIAWLQPSLRGLGQQGHLEGLAQPTTRLRRGLSSLHLPVSGNLRPDADRSSSAKKGPPGP